MVGNIKVNLKDVELGGLDWVNLAVNRRERRTILSKVMNSEWFYKMQGISGVDEKPLILNNAHASGVGWLPLKELTFKRRGFCSSGNERRSFSAVRQRHWTLESIKVGKFIDRLRNDQVLRVHSFVIHDWVQSTATDEQLSFWGTPDSLVAVYQINTLLLLARCRIAEIKWDV